MQNFLKRLLVLTGTILAALGIGYLYHLHTPIHPFMVVTAWFGLFIGLIDESEPQSVFNLAFWSTVIGLILGVFSGLLFQDPTTSGSSGFYFPAFLNTFALIGGFGIATLIGDYLSASDSCNCNDENGSRADNSAESEREE